MQALVARHLEFFPEQDNFQKLVHLTLEAIVDLQLNQLAHLLVFAEILAVFLGLLYVGEIFEHPVQ